MKSTEIKFTYIYSQFDSIIEKFKILIKECNQSKFKAYLDKLLKESQSIRENPVLKIAFIGQYSAGKSTIISALTGDKSIKIGSDITTDQATDYHWQGIKIVDTPGIGTERQDHDVVTYEAIKQADLLIFCTTHMLLDNHIIEHFKCLAYEKKYAHKMMLIFNKLSAEAGDDDQKIENYCSSIAQSLYPHSLDDFPVCFFDAKDYLEGINDNDEMLVELSRFPDFIRMLNQFIKDKDKLAQLDTPIRRVLDYIVEVKQEFISNPEQDKIFFDTLNRLSRRVRENHQRLQIQVQNIFLDSNSKIHSLGSDLANDLTKFKNESEFKNRQERIEVELQEIWNDLEKKVQDLAINSIDSLEKDIREVLDSQVIVDFVAKLDSDTELETRSFSKGFNFSNLSKQVQAFRGIATEIGMQLGKQSVRQSLIIGESQSLINTMGSPLHQNILQAGKFVGFKFKPWQAVKLANNVGKYAKFVGPILAIVTLTLDVAEEMQQEQQARELKDAQSSIEKEFDNIAKAMKIQLNSQIKELEDKTFNNIEMKIQFQREKYQNQIEQDKLKVKEFEQLQKKLTILIENLIS
ncbi:MAG: GTPase [Snowella sp.]|nr:GTPase [Snowella sp.]